MTQLHPRDPENRQQNRFSERRFSKKKNQVTTGWMGNWALSVNNAKFGKESSYIRIDVNEYRKTQYRIFRIYQVFISACRPLLVLRQKH